uniref:Uncharacterized protein n=1 Tax=Medicago truncatula TaxID=3880 RepID=A2Q6B9_MEDTR|nr:hypothetical protein MtrDRAFT_AC174467g14v1 [Medicago truncatula]
MRINFKDNLHDDSVAVTVCVQTIIIDASGITGSE